MSNRTVSKTNVTITDILTNNGAQNLDGIQAFNAIKDWLEEDKLNAATFVVTISNNLGFVKYLEGDIGVKRNLLLGTLKMYQNDERHDVDTVSDPDRTEPNIVNPDNSPPFNPDLNKEVSIRIKTHTAEINLEGDKFSANFLKPNHTFGLFHGFGALQDKSDTQLSDSPFSKAYFTLAVRQWWQGDGI